jgi:hypothetical protein
VSEELFGGGATGNRIGNEGATAMADALATSTTLREVDMGGVYGGQVGERSPVHAATARCHRGRELDWRRGREIDRGRAGGGHCIVDGGAAEG